MPKEPEPVVADTGPLLALAACGQMRVLLTLHPRVIVPQAVVDELSQGGCWPPQGATEEEFEERELEGSLPALVEAHLDLGEASVLALALEQGVERVVVDERQGRQVARTLGLSVTGSVGVSSAQKRWASWRRRGPVWPPCATPGCGSPIASWPRSSARPARSSPKSQRGESNS